MKHLLAKVALVALLLLPCEARAGSMVASYYNTGTMTANGERFRPHGDTCAHRTLPFGTILRITYGGRSATCRVNDRGPFVRGRHLDMCQGVADRLGFRGVHSVGVEVLAHRRH